jgi:hypothetical protein
MSFSNWGWRLPEPSEVPPVDPDEFATAFNLVLNAAAGRVALEHKLGDPPESPASSAEPPAGPPEPSKYWDIADKPLNRGLAALRERYTDPAKFNYIALRVAGLTFVLGRSALAPWIERDLSGQGNLQVHPAVLDAAAVSPLGPGYEFELPPLVDNIQSAVARRYSEE